MTPSSGPYAQENIYLRQVIRGAEDPFTSLSFAYARRAGIHGWHLSDLSLSYFCHRIAGYPKHAPYSANTDFTYPRQQLAKALLRRDREDLLSDPCRLIPKWIFFNANPHGEVETQSLAEHTHRGHKSGSADIRTVYQDYLSSTIASHRRIVPQSDMNLVDTIERLPTSGTMEVPPHILDGIEAHVIHQGGDTNGIDRKLYRVELFRRSNCSSRAFLESRKLTDNLSSTPVVDANFGGVLTYDGRYCCLFSGVPLDDGETFLVVQLQGSAIDRSTRGRPFAEEFLRNSPHITKIAVRFNLMLAIEYARMNSFRKIALVPGALNHSALTHEAKRDMSHEEHTFYIPTAKRIYDGAARQLKFNLFDPAFSGYHSLDIAPLS